MAVSRAVPLCWWLRPRHPLPTPAAGAQSSLPYGVHLYVFVHGFHGNAYDLRGMRNQLAILLPDKRSARFLLSAINEVIRRDIRRDIRRERVTQLTRLPGATYAIGNSLAGPHGARLV